MQEQQINTFQLTIFRLYLNLMKISEMTLTLVVQLQQMIIFIKRLNTSQVIYILNLMINQINFQILMSNRLTMLITNQSIISLLITNQLITNHQNFNHTIYKAIQNINQHNQILQLLRQKSIQNHIMKNILVSQLISKATYIKVVSKMNQKMIMQLINCLELIQRIVNSNQIIYHLLLIPIHLVSLLTNITILPKTINFKANHLNTNHQITLKIIISFHKAILSSRLHLQMYMHLKLRKSMSRNIHLQSLLIMSNYLV